VGEDVQIFHCRGCVDKLPGGFLHKEFDVDIGWPGGLEPLQSGVLSNDILKP
jgi:hypothetical protein